MGGERARQRRLRIETVRGEPYGVGGRQLTPVARIVSFGRARGTVRTARISGWGAGFAQITPLAMVEEADGGAREIVITDATATALRAMMAGAVVIVLTFSILRWLIRWRRGSQDGGSEQALG